MHSVENNPLQQFPKVSSQESGLTCRDMGTPAG